MEAKTAKEERKTVNDIVSKTKAQDHYNTTTNGNELIILIRFDFCQFKKETKLFTK